MHCKLVVFCFYKVYCDVRMCHYICLHTKTTTDNNMNKAKKNGEIQHWTTTIELYNFVSKSTPYIDFERITIFLFK